MRSNGRGDDAASLGHARVMRTTPDALLVTIDSVGRQWVPRSVVHDDSEVYDDGHEGELVVKQWWARKEGLV